METGFAIRALQAWRTADAAKRLNLIWRAASVSIRLAPSESPEASPAMIDEFQRRPRTFTHPRATPSTNNPSRSANARQSRVRAIKVLPASIAMPARLGFGRPLNCARTDCRQVDAEILPALRSFHQNATRAAAAQCDHSREAR